MANNSNNPTALQIVSVDTETRVAANAFSASYQKTFQKIEFLVRDWQNFKDEEDIDACEIEMQRYLEKSVLATPAGANDLRDTRNQIHTCFKEISCFQIIHPGGAVTRRNYNGDTTVIDPLFKKFMNRYCQKVIRDVVAKNINGRDLTASELGYHIPVYAKLFQNKSINFFPQATAMLEAVTSANNNNASRLSINQYKELMEQYVGPNVETYVSPEFLSQINGNITFQCLKLFDEMACFGDVSAIEEARSYVERALIELFTLYSTLNDDRKPNEIMNGCVMCSFCDMLLVYFILVKRCPHIFSRRSPFLQTQCGSRCDS